ncbi:hypothetical protein P3T18_003586 [Paraburkholderia sp. GAS199]|uniref:GCG_CRPN prefix-to-repeats domain-containing protein n=1 Tax=Paraburkholderia sp. GAS199 TaxID=3035126 RepID=UPI003D20F3B8
MNRTKLTLIGVATAASLFVTGYAQAAQGCGPNGWRNAWGVCRYAAPVIIQAAPVIYTPPPVVASPYACPPGSWLGPWGHCRNTPYHGRLPNGQWQ